MKIAITTENVTIKLENDAGESFFTSTTHKVETRIDVMKLIEAAGTMGPKLEKLMAKLHDQAAE